ncbi:phosphoribosylanthranilate isomerase [Methanosarcina mazei]|uniref:N-(5'-phosphoribosyl)anthranilate isomerase n=2 Tax=Methanosarcina mazei TaxID=2209 RepID=A0A0F8M2K3_METMZ|nr:phosphoribosylanthranilate isomerase [Methanosarcina mazei]AKB40808.1 Phosphoribosylanthranilate isomerase [Methanosarcina mazei WWM610]KKG01827.1 N-(5'-phosphoribosyl)anthranilate isomerase [Methanosarcina mazei]KKG51760.1 N-(5'-phosphoribosyl)anthranilate isomerase [Methanosarcina mazei]KKG57695.1 N-(5'-phosphoribosyl)anthranilate isomerase [Methanosarcina mazei]KKG61152.1 N-(5'-phosphoribosyl)anthranilate isomerase [Methanosarcina mazei]
MRKRLKTRIKICGMCSPEDMEMAALYGADAVGFITEVPIESPRKLDSDTAASLISKLPECLDSVMVIMPENSSRALELIEKVRPDIVQIHSNMPSVELEVIREKTDIPIIKTLSVPAGMGASRVQSPVKRLLDEVRRLEESGVVDSILLDSGIAGKTGGTGYVHDWDLSRRIADETELPLILAGGLKPENVQEAIRIVSPYAVDTASGVETLGIKDAVKIRSFIEEVRCANAFL